MKKPSAKQISLLLLSLLILLFAGTSCSTHSGTSSTAKTAKQTASSADTTTTAQAQTDALSESMQIYKDFLNGKIKAQADGGYPLALKNYYPTSYDNSYQYAY